MSKNKNKIWFKKIRGSYLPSSTTGLVIYLSYTAYLIALITIWYLENSSVWNLIVFVIPLSVGAALLTQYIASKHSK